MLGARQKESQTRAVQWRGPGYSKLLAAHRYWK